MRRGAEAYFAVGWIVFGAAVLAGAWRMDRLESLRINPWSAPGLMPGVLGALMLVFGAALALRAFRERTPQAGTDAAQPSRVTLALVLCFGYAAGLLGHGLPYWLASAAFLFIAICAFRWLDRDAETWTRPARLALSSAAIAIGAALAIGLLFEQVFLVRLP